MQAVFFWKPYQRPRLYARWRWYVSVWGPAALAVGIICLESTELFSSKNTSGWLRPLIERAFGPFTNGAWGLFHHTLRKCGHFIGYGGVGFAFLRAWLHTLGERAPRSVAMWRWMACLYAVLSTTVVAGCDELHQTFLPDRTGAVSDVGLDTCGAIVMCAAVWVVCWVGRRVDDEGEGSGLR